LIHPTALNQNAEDPERSAPESIENQNLASALQAERSNTLLMVYFELDQAVNWQIPRERAPVLGFGTPPSKRK
jgi:hypothetical protein